MAVCPAFATVAIEATVESQPIPERVKDMKLSQPPAAKTWKEKILLDNDHLAVDGPGGRILIDFTARRKYVIDAKAGTYLEWSLYGDVGFRVYEIMNRAQVVRILTAIHQLDGHQAAGEGGAGRSQPELALHHLEVAERLRRG